MRLLCLLLMAGLAVSCAEPKPKAESVRKYCQLTTMPHATVADLWAIERRAVELFEERKPYKTTDANRRVIQAATSLSVASRAQALRVEKPELFQGSASDPQLPLVHAELVAACAALPKDEKR